MNGRSPFQRFLGELKRRHVPQTLAVYAVAAWAAIQFADVVVPNLGWPQTVVTVVIIAAAIGLPLVIILAWLLEWGPDGLHRTPDEPASVPPRSQAGGRPGEAPTRPGPISYGPWFAALTVLAVAIGGALVVVALMGGEPGVIQAEAGDAPQTRSERRRSDPPPARPPAAPMIGPAFSDSIRLVVDSVREAFGLLEGMDSIVNVGRILEQSLGAATGSRAILVVEPPDLLYGAAATVGRGDTLEIEGLARDTAGITEVEVDGEVVERAEGRQPVVTFRARILGDWDVGARTIPIIARTRDGRELRSELTVVLRGGGRP